MADFMYKDQDIFTELLTGINLIISMDPIAISSLAIILIYLGIMFLKPKLSFYLLIFLCIFQLGWFERYYSATSILARMTYIAGLISGVRIIIDLCTKKIIIRQNDFAIKYILSFIILLVCAVLISNTYNGESIILGIFELRYYLIMTILCFGIYYYHLIDLNEENLTKIIISIGLCQIPFAILQYIVAGGGQNQTLDSVTGTFTNYANLVACQMMAIGLSIFNPFKFRANRPVVNKYLLSMSLIFPLLLSKSRAATGFIILMFSFVYLKSALSKASINIFIRNIIIGSATLVIVGTLFYQFFWKTNYKIQEQFSPEYIINYITKDPITSIRKYHRGLDPRMGRIRSITESVKIISQDPLTVLFGYGSGSVSEASLLSMQGRLFQWIGPLAGIGRTQYSKIISELGMVGIGIFIYLFYTFFRLFHNHSQGNPRPLNNYTVLLFTTILLSFYSKLLSSHFVALSLALFFCYAQARVMISSQTEKP